MVSLVLTIELIGQKFEWCVTLLSGVPLPLPPPLQKRERERGKGTRVIGME
jgi:hypothetical protein